MEAALLTVATGALKPVLGKLAALLGDEYKHFKGLREEIRFLTDELTFMHAFLLKMSEEEDPDVQDKVWMAAVRELSYEMEDSIDDFMQSVDDKGTKPDGFIEKIKHSLGKLGKMKNRRRISKEIQDLKKQVIEVGERNARYKSGGAIFSTMNFSRTTKVIVDPRALSMFEHASKLVGIDKLKAEIIKLLTEGALIDEQPKLVSIIGSGGMGKTTLANQVYQDLKENFECHAFLSVSRNPDMMNIMRIIHSQVSGLPFSNTEAGSIQQVIFNINSFLADRRYFVVVDDIWDVHTWDVIKRAFPVTSPGSIIISTTRINDVAELCRSSFNGDIYSMRPLDPVHSKELFHRRLFDSKESLPSHLEKVSDEILKKCDGLPLAIIAISGLLARRERTEDLWNQVKDSIGRALERNHSVEGMMKILSLSYFDLPPHLKTCLLYVSVFPEDYSIWRNDLIRRWIGEEFIQEEGRYTAHEIGEKCFNELLNRGLIQPEQTNEFGEVESCRVHDTILDFIISKSIEENFVTTLGVPILTKTQNKVVHRLSLHAAKRGNSTAQTTYMVLSHVRSLNVFGYFVKIPSLDEFKHLRVLNLKNCRQFKEHHLENIVKLFQLRYLNLESTRISKLPAQIGCLRFLDMLDIRHTRVEALPASIVNLEYLSHLLVDGRVIFPDGIAKMQALETLGDVGVPNQPFDFLCGLAQLKNLRNLELDLALDVESNTEDTNVVGEERNQAIVSSLCKLGTQNLCFLTIWGGSNLLQEHLCMLTLKKLITESSAVPQVPKWVSSLTNLQQLSLQVEGVKQDDLSILGALPTLFILHLKELTEPNEKLRITGAVGFRFLRIFNYDASFHPVDLLFTTGSMPKLEKLVLRSLSMVEADSLDFGIENLPCLSTVKVDGDYGNFEAVKTAMEKATNAHPNHPSLLFTVDELPGDFCSGRFGVRPNFYPGRFGVRLANSQVKECLAQLFCFA